MTIVTAEFLPDWQILGPFQIGTREGPWGADPIEHYGGITSLQHNTEDNFKSSLAPQGCVRWKHVRFQPTQQAQGGPFNIAIDVDFPEVDWLALRNVYGWPALQYQAWARGILMVHSKTEQTAVLLCPGLLEIIIDGQRHFGGDFYHFQKAPLVLHLQPGSHILNLRLIRDIRSMGAVADPPSVHCHLTLRIQHHELLCNTRHFIVPDLVDRTLAGRYGTVPITNLGTSSLTISQIISSSAQLRIVPMCQDLVLMPGQTRPMPFTLDGELSAHSNPTLQVVYQIESGATSTLDVGPLPIKQRAISEMHRLTFVRPGGIVSHAMIRPPNNSTTAPSSADRPAYPVMVNLHGAGVEIADDEMRHCLDEIADLPLWVVMPAGVTPWCADDWHNWGSLDVEAALQSLHEWIERMHWTGPSANTNKRLLVGHSNGGQGVWYGLTHNADKIIGAAPSSGYLSIQSYVPYNMWRETEPLKTSIIMMALQDFRHECLVENVRGIPIYQQHGDADENVPVFHSRRMSELLSESKWQSSYNEIVGAPHWFDGIMTTPPLKDFYTRILKASDKRTERPRSFTVVSANPATTGTVNGVTIDVLRDPGRLGKIEIVDSPNTLLFRTSNVVQFSIDQAHIEHARACKHGIMIDYEQFWSVSANETKTMSFVSIAQQHWQMGCLESTTVLDKRLKQQQGTLHSVLQSEEALTIVYRGAESYPVALQISRNLYQYYSADSRIFKYDDDQNLPRGNRITVVTATAPPHCASAQYPIVAQPSFIQIMEGDTVLHSYHQNRESQLGAVFVRPLPDFHVELVVWGVDKCSLETAARLVPTVTGVGQPDFVVTSSSSLGDGVGGALAMGFLDFEWKVSKSSFIS